MAGELILVVDDEPNIVELAQIYLEKDGFRVEGVGDGKAALEAVEKSKPALSAQIKAPSWLALARLPAAKL